MERPLGIEELLSHAGWLRGLAASLVRDPASADDLVQDTWLAALRHPPAGSARGWLARVAGNLARNARRSRGRRAEHEGLAREERVAPAPDAALEEAEVQRLLAELVTELDEPLRRVVVLRWFRGLDSAAIARELGLSDGAVRTRQQRALAELRAKLDRRSGREAWVALLAPLARRAPVAAAGAGALLPLAAALALVAGGTLAWRATRAQPTRVLGPDRTALAAAPAEAAVDDVAAVARESLPVATGAPGGPGADSAPSAAEDGVELAGVVLVDGAEPRWPLELVLDPVRPGAGTTQPARPAAEVTWPGPWKQLFLEPEARGVFSFGPVPADFAGRLTVLDHPLESGRHALRLDAPAADLVLRVRSGPAITGRYVDARGAPLAGAACNSEVRGAVDALERIEWRQVVTWPDGGFRIPLDDSDDLETATATLLLEVDDRGYARTEVEVRIADGVDLGDVMAEPVRRLAFRVLGEDGTPIAGAVAQVGEELRPRGEPDRTRRSAPTDAEGRGELRFAPERAADLRFSAPRHASERLTVEPGAAPEVRLARLTCLDVRVSGAPEGARLALTAGMPPYALDLESEDGLTQLDLGAARPDHWHEQENLHRFTVGDGLHLLAGLRADVPLTLELTDAGGDALASAVVTLGSGEWRALELAP